MNKKHVIAAVVVLILLSGVGWALFSGEDRVVAEAKQQRDELFEKVDTMSDQERRAGFEALRETTRNFTEAQRREFGNGMRRFFMQRVDKLLAMPKAERDQQLDKWIDRMEAMRKNRDAKGDGPGGPGRGGPGGSGPGGGDKSRAGGANRGKQRLDRSTPEMRAKLDVMKDLVNARRAERGMDPIQGPPGRFGGGRR